jgi:uncharacterized protein (DUF58 family)
VLGSVVGLGAWAAVGHNSGSGWVQALGALLGAFVLIGMLAPAVAVWRARCAVGSSPAEVVAGGTATFEVTSSTALEIRPTAPSGDAVLSGDRGTVALTVVPTRRGVLTECTVVVASAAPFGLLWWTRRLVLPLPRPLLVTPRVGSADPALPAGDQVTGDGDQRRAARVGEPRGVRDYRPGDRRHWVHWPATAHTGSLMVREMEGPATSPVVVEVVLPVDPDAADRKAERVMGTVAELFRRGDSVLLITTEAGGTRADHVSTLGEAGRRLALAVGSAPVL